MARTYFVALTCFSIGGCNSIASYSKKIEDDLWLCAFDNTNGGTWEQGYSACNQGANFHLATTTSMTQRGAPSNSNISNAITWARSKNFDYVVNILTWLPWSFPRNVLAASPRAFAKAFLFITNLVICVSGLLKYSTRLIAINLHFRVESWATQET